MQIELRVHDTSTGDEFELGVPTSTQWTGLGLKDSIGDVLFNLRQRDAMCSQMSIKLDGIEISDGDLVQEAGGYSHAPIPTRPCPHLYSYPTCPGLVLTYPHP